MTPYHTPFHSFTHVTLVTYNNSGLIQRPGCYKNRILRYKLSASLKLSTVILTGSTHNNRPTCSKSRHIRSTSWWATIFLLLWLTMNAVQATRRQLLPCVRHMYLHSSRSSVVLTSEFTLYMLLLGSWVGLSDTSVPPSTQGHSIKCGWWSTWCGTG